MNLFYIQNLTCTCGDDPEFKATPEQPHHPDCPRAPYLNTVCPVCKQHITLVIPIQWAPNPDWDLVGVSLFVSNDDRKHASTQLELF